MHTGNLVQNCWILLIYEVVCVCWAHLEDCLWCVDHLHGIEEAYEDILDDKVHILNTQISGPYVVTFVN